MSREAAAFVVAAASDLGACVCEDDATVSEWNDLSALIDLIDAREATIRVQAEQIAALQEALTAARRERDEVYAVNAAANYDRANAAEEALQQVVALCEPDRVPLPLWASKILRVARPALALAEGCAAPADEKETR